MRAHTLTGEPDRIFPIARLQTLVRRIKAWEDMEGVDAVEAAEELILDIKQCLESVLGPYEG